jgi:hypothetical protein
VSPLNGQSLYGSKFILSSNYIGQIYTGQNLYFLRHPSQSWHKLSDNIWWQRNIHYVQALSKNKTCTSIGQSCHRRSRTTPCAFISGLATLSGGQKTCMARGQFWHDLHSAKKWWKIGEGIFTDHTHAMCVQSTETHISRLCMKGFYLSCFVRQVALFVYSLHFLPSPPPKSSSLLTDFKGLLSPLWDCIQKRNLHIKMGYSISCHYLSMCMGLSWKIWPLL